MNNKLPPQEPMVKISPELDTRQYVIYMDGLHDDTEAMQAAIDGKEVRWPDGKIYKEAEHLKDNDNE